MSKRVSSTPASRPVHFDVDGYDSSYEGDEEENKTKKKKLDLKIKEAPKPINLTSKSYFTEQSAVEARKSMLSHLRGLTAYDRHKMLINEYYMSNPGAMSIFKRDMSKDKKDIDVIRANHQFVWESDDAVDTWGKQLAKKYYDKLFKEYCICDLRRYKENKVGIRWRVEKEVVSGKGQFNCGEQNCTQAENLRTWEVNFAYMEHGTKKNTLVKIRLCPECSHKLNYVHQKKEIVKKKRKNKKEKRRKSSSKSDDEAEKRREDKPSEGEEHEEVPTPGSSKDETGTSGTSDVWRETQALPEEKSRDEEFEEYLQDLMF